MIQDGSKVTLHYTLTVDGKKVDSSEGKEPLTYTQGKGEIVPGLESELAGLKKGDKKTITVSPEG
ncbi:MAG: FKBP-type peptidyl-prolyl cis-trans isomerase, partial [bacterium]|nr:FKBP-type peptidyl-prolyl cis-trans isomerase [bacterium]